MRLKTNFFFLSRFCENLGLNLLEIDSREKYEAVVKILLIAGVGIDRNFMIGNLRESFFQSQTWANTINANGNQGRKDQCISIFLDRYKENGQFVYFDCNDDYKYQNFVCEKIMVKNIWLDQYSNIIFKNTNISRKAMGMKILGTAQKSKKFCYLIIDKA